MTLPAGTAGDAGTRLRAAAVRGNIDALRTLLEAGTPSDAPSGNGWTALMQAAKRGHAEAVRLLLAHGADPRAVNDAGHDALWYAVNALDGELTRSLLAHGADPNRREGRPDEPPHYRPHRMTALMVAAMEGADDVTRALLDHGADPDPYWIEIGTSWNVLTALSLAITFRHPSCARLLVERGADVNAGADAAGRVRLSYPDEGGEAGFRIAGVAGVREFFVKTPLMQALSRGYDAMVDLLLASGARPIGPVLFYAYRRGDTARLERWLDLGADPNVGDAFGWTVLMSAVEEGDQAAVRLLLRRGADPNLGDGQDSPLTVAESRRRRKRRRPTRILSLLRRAGATG